MTVAAIDLRVIEPVSYHGSRPAIGDSEAVVYTFQTGRGASRAVDKPEEQPDVEINPYQAPRAEVGGERLGEQKATRGQPTEAMLRGLKGTSPWTTLLAILGFIAGGFMLLSGFSSAVAIPFIATTAHSEAASFTTAIMAYTAVFYIVGGAAYGSCSYFLARYSQAIGRVGRTQSLEDFESALGVQFRFWKTVGIATIALVVVVVLFMIGIIALSFAMVGDGYLAAG
jgi:hypothetical protein